MSDNFPETPGSGRNVATDQVTYSSDTADVQLVRPVLVTGAEGSKTVIDLPGDTANGLDIDVTRLPTDVALADNAGFTDGTTKVIPSGYIFDEVAGTALTENDVAAARIDSKRAMVNVLEDATTRGQRAAVSAAGALMMAGVAAADAAVSGNPILNAARGSNTIPTAMSADGDVTQLWTNLRGMIVASMVPGAGLNSDPFNLKFVAEQQTTTQTSHTLLTPTSGKKICVTSYQLQIGGTTAGNIQVYFGTGSFSRGTNRTIIDGDFVPSSTQKPGVVAQGPFWAAAVDDLIRITTSANLTYTISIWYYEV